MDTFRGTPKFYDVNDDVNMNTTTNYDYTNIGVKLSDIQFTDINISNIPGIDDIIRIKGSENIPYKYAEDRIISEFKAYIDKTYSEHYKTDQQNIECFDAWIALDDATPTFRNTALKYLWRYGKKNGSNKNDLMKALHYTLMCLYNDHYKDGK